MEVAAIFLVCMLFFHREVVHAQEAAIPNRPVINPLALGGMVQGLLDMQIRPQGGFYEDRYKDIFIGDSNVALATNIDKRHSSSNSMNSKLILSEDGSSLADAASGKSPNPCFDLDRIARNRLLLLMCSLQLADQMSDNSI